MTYNKKVKEEILTKALKVFKADPTKLNNHNVAKEMGISNGKIHYHFGTKLKESTMAYAIEQQDSQVIAGLLASKDPLVADMSEEDRERHLNAVFG